ncbi:MAG: hypothetical protein ACTS78_04465 [Arsenophonus sp. NC-WZS1-MAG3]
MTYNTPDVSKITATEVLGITNAGNRDIGMKGLQNTDSLFSFR